MAVIAHRRWTDCVFGVAGNAVLFRQAAPTIAEARRLHHQRGALARAHDQAPPTSSRLSDAFSYAARSWAQPGRVIRKAAVMSAGDNPRFVVTSLDAPTPQTLDEDLYCARGNCANALKAVKVDLRSDRPSATTFLANAARLLLACAAYALHYALHHAVRTQTLQHTVLAQAQPSTIIVTLFKIAAQVKQYKDRILLHLPASCPVKALLQRVTMLLCAVPVPVGNTS